jgi:hypothetical protein
MLHHLCKMKNKKDFWIRLSLINLSVVGLLGFALRSKILFTIPWLDYRYVLSAHSHFAFGAWVGLGIMTLLVYQLLPPALSVKRVYQWILAGITISSWGMALSFPFGGYYSVSIVFSTSFIVFTYWFGIAFIRDLFKVELPGSIKLLGVTSLLSLIASSAGPVLLSYIMISRSADSVLYRDAIYTFLHFQYNGFFTLAVFALFFERAFRKGIDLKNDGKRFALFLSLSVLPALFLSLLWHNSTLYYVIAGCACILIILCLFYFFRLMQRIPMGQVFNNALSKNLAFLSFASFGLKMILNIGTIIPQLSNAVYGDRPVIIGFLHLVFLAFVSFFLLADFISNGIFTRRTGLPKAPFYVFGGGVFANELLLMLQGLGILFRTNSDIYAWLLWIASIVLFAGGIMLAASAWSNKKATDGSVAQL